MAVHVGGKGPWHLARVMGSWTPAALGSSLLGWWDAEDASTITQSGGLVSSWRDKVAGYDAVQATGASKPVYSATSFNSRPGLTFDGVDDELTLASVPFPTGASASEVWALVDQLAPTADGGTRRILAYGGNANTTSRQLTRGLIATVSRATSIVGSGAGTTFADNLNVVFEGRHVARLRVTGTEARTDVDGVAGASQSVTPATGTTRTRLGASTADVTAGFWSGQFAAVLVTGALSEPQAAQLLAYFKARGGIA